jgi:hypothetical protein
MRKKKKGRTASDVLEHVVSRYSADYISFEEIKIALHERGFGLLMLIFALPLSIPMPVPPGLTLIPAIPLLFFSVQMLLGKNYPWLPKWLGRKKIKRKTLALFIEAASPYLKRIEKLLRPRYSFATSSAGERVVGFFAVIFSLSIANPVPFSNLIPAIGIVLMSLGLLSKDGIPIVIGMIVGSVGVCISIAIIFFGSKAVEGIVAGLPLF